MDDEIAKRMKEVESVVLTLDESVRGAAFTMMESYILTGQNRKQRVPADVSEDLTNAVGREEDVQEEDDDVAAFFNDREIQKPAEAVYAVAAYFYSQYGSAPFTTKDVQDIADQVGLTVPDRLDNTLRNAGSNKKSVFKTKGGGWIPTTTGELVLKEKFDVKKGRKKRTADADDGR